MRPISLVVLSLAVLSGCPAGDCPPCPEEAHVEQALLDHVNTTPATGGDLTAFEHTLVDPVLDDIRQGIRPFTSESVGICKGQGKECEEYLGLDVGELPPGQYMVRAEFRVPRSGEPGTWKVQFDTECTTTRTTASGESTSTSSNTRDYDVRYAGEDRGYRLSPLYSIDSPSTGGARSCTFKLIGLHPDGDKVIQGSWSTPDAG
jgi:hypothetical protein